MLEMDNIPLYELQTLYYQLWKEREEESKMSEEERSGAALGRMIEDEIY